MLVSYERTKIEESNWRLKSDFFASDNQFQHYYGTGNNTSRSSDLESAGFYQYHFQQLFIETSARHPYGDIPGLDFLVGIGGQVFSSVTKILPSEFSNDFGVARKGYFSYLWAKVILERRNSEFIPSTGFFLSTSLKFSPDFLGSLNSWSRFDFDNRDYIPILKDRWLWLATQLRYTATSSQTPLNEKARLGSPGTLRGFPLNRFIDSQSFSARVELRTLTARIELFDRPLKIGQLIFADLGRSGDTLGELIQNKTHSAVGLGLFGSYFTDDFINTAEYGFSDEGSNFYVGLGLAF